MANKKGMGVEQVFIFIIAGLTFALIAIFGYRAIQDFLQKGEVVEFTRFKNHLENSIKSLSTEFGSVQIVDFAVPSRYQQVCLVDMDYQPTEEELQQLCALDQVACTVWKQAQQTAPAGESGFTKVDENVFLTPPGHVPIKVAAIRPDGPGFLCQAIRQGQFSLRLEGRGSYTQLSAVS